MTASNVFSVTEPPPPLRQVRIGMFGSVSAFVPGFRVCVCVCVCVWGFFHSRSLLRKAVRPFASHWSKRRTIPQPGLRPGRGTERRCPSFCQRRSTGRTVLADCLSGLIGLDLDLDLIVWSGWGSGGSVSLRFVSETRNPMEFAFLESQNTRHPYCIVFRLKPGWLPGVPIWEVMLSGGSDTDLSGT